MVGERSKTVKSFLVSLLNNPITRGLAISAGVEYLATLVKDPNSKGARAARTGVETVRDACNQFLEAVPAPEPEATGE